MIKWVPMWVKLRENGEYKMIQSNHFNGVQHEKVSAEEVNLEDVGSNVNSECDKYYCSPCDKEFKREQDFKTHNTKYHSE